MAKAYSTKDERQVAARIAREMADRLRKIADNIESADDPSEDIEAVHRARFGLRGLKYERETYTRLCVIEALDRALYYSERVSPRTKGAGRSGPPPLTPVSLPVVLARGLFAGSCPGIRMDDPDPWVELLTEWRIGPGAPRKTEKRVGSKWNRLALLFRAHVPGCPKLAGRTLESEWNDWKGGLEHLDTRPPKSTR